MSKGYFIDKSKRPFDNDINRIIGLGKNNWNLLIHYLMDVLKLKGELKFYGVNYGWALRFRKSSKSLIALYPDKDSFTIQIILNKNQEDLALTQVVNQHMKKLIKDKKSLHEGKWIYVRIDDGTDVKDIYTFSGIPHFRGLGQSRLLPDQR